MKSKNQKLLVGIGALVIIFVLYSVITTGKKEKKDAETVSENQVTIKQAREEKEKLIENGINGKYKHLYFEDFKFDDSFGDSVYKLKLKYPVTYQNMELKEVLQVQVNTLKAFYGDKLDMDYVYDQSVAGDKFYIAEKQIKNGTYSKEQLPYLVYHKDEYHAQVDAGISALWMDVGLDGITEMNNSKTLETIYYPYDTEEKLQDTYKTENGTLSVKEGIEKVETYFNENFPIAQTEKELHRVVNAKIVEKEDKNHAFQFALTREYDGVKFESAISGTMAYNLDERVDLTDAIMDGNGSVLYFSGYCCNTNYIEEKSFTTILSPTVAMQRIADKIGENSEYEVNSMGLIYAEREKEDCDYNVATPVWQVTVTNKVDQKKTYFYVNVENGEVTSRVIG